MTIYVAMLRGINVGGKNIIKMVELKRVLEGIGLSDVKTYIQSGNILFRSHDGEEALRKKIEKAIETDFGLFVIVVLRTAEEFEKIITHCPFSTEEIVEAEFSLEAVSLYVSLLTHVPSQEKIESLDIYRSESEEYRIVGREVFLLLHQSILKSKIANHLHKLDVPATVRNWKTINKLAALLKDMGSRFE